MYIHDEIKLWIHFTQCAFFSVWICMSRFILWFFVVVSHSGDIKSLKLNTLIFVVIVMKNYRNENGF